jgi:hypothetical protein
MHRVTFSKVCRIEFWYQTFFEGDLTDQFPHMILAMKIIDFFSDIHFVFQMKVHVEKPLNPKFQVV